MDQQTPIDQRIEAEVALRVAQLREDPDRQLRYDRNGDGIVDEDEWELVRRVIRRELRAERGAEPATADAADAAPSSVGRVIAERYEVVGRLGRGAQGIMHLAEDRHTGGRVAVKELALGRVEQWKAVELFEREAAVLESLDHPGIPSYIDHFHDEDDAGELTFYLVQEYMAGEPLSARLDDGMLLDEAGARELMRAVLGILDYLHALNPPVVHRDIKPSNIICRPDGRLAVVDFGAVQTILPDDVGGSTVVGTSGYMPPEQLIGRAQPASDVYALAATVVAAMSGREPHELDMVRMRLQFRGAVDASEGFCELLDQMLDPTVERRLASAPAVLAAMQSSPQVRLAGQMAPAPADESTALATWSQAQDKVARLEDQAINFNATVDADPERLEVVIGPWDPPPQNWLMPVVVLAAAFIFSIFTAGCGLVVAIPLSIWGIYKGWNYLRPASERLVLDRDTLLLERRAHTSGGLKLLRSDTFDVGQLYLPHVHRHQMNEAKSARQQVADPGSIKRSFGAPGLIFTDTSDKRVAFAETLYTQHQFTRVGLHEDHGALDWLDELVTTYLEYFRGHDDD